MAFLTKVGSFNTGTGTSNIVVTGVGFQPKALILWWSGRTETTDTSSEADIKAGIGFAITSTDRRCVTISNVTGLTTTATDRRIDNVSCIATLTDSGTVDGLADVSSMDSDGFTLVIDDIFSTDIRVHYLALGGSDLTNFKTGQFKASNSTGDQDITDVAFQPDSVLFISVEDTGVPPVEAVNARMTFGAAAGATIKQASSLVTMRDAQTTTDTWSYSIAGEIALGGTSTNQIRFRGSVTSWLSNGFRINWAETINGNNCYIFYLALKGGKYYIDNLLTETNTTTDIVETGFGFSPKSAIFVSHCKTQSTSDTSQSHAEMSIGAFSSTTEHISQGLLGIHGFTSNSTSSVAVEHDEVYANISTSDPFGIEGLMDIKSIDSNGFTCIMDDADPTANFVWFLAFGGGATQQTKTYSTDSLLKKLRISKTFSVDTFIKKLNAAKTYLVDTVLTSGILTTRSKTYSADALLLHQTSFNDTAFFGQLIFGRGIFGKSGESVLIPPTPAILGRLRLGTTRLGESIVSGIKQYIVDFIISRANIIKTYTVDTILAVNNKIKTYLADSLLLKTVNKSYSSDSLFKKLQVIKTYTIDTIIQAIMFNRTKTYITDAFIKKLNILKTYISDVLIQKLNLKPGGYVQLYYDMETLKAGKMKDLSERGNDGTITGTIDVAGVHGRARQFDGINDKVEATSALSGLSNWTFAFWLKWAGNTSVQYRHPIHVGGATIYFDTTLSQGNGKWVAFTGLGMNGFIGYLEPNRWYHITLTCDGTNSRAYLDGLFVTTGTSGTMNDNVVRIGTGTTQYWDGLIDEVYIFNHALTQQEIINLKDNVPGSLLDHGYIVDIFLKKLGAIKSYTIDTLLRKLNFSKTYQSDALFKKLNITKTYLSDTFLRKLFSKTYESDVIIKRPNFTKTYIVDNLYKKLTIVKTYISNVMIKRLQKAGGYVQLYYNMETLQAHTGKMKDLTEKGHEGTIIGTTDVAGIYGRARQFDGTQDCIYQNGVLAGAQAASVAAWVKLNSVTDYGRIFDHGWIFNAIALMQLGTTGKIGFFTSDAVNNQALATSQTLFTDGNWHHVVGTWKSGGEQKIYVDGVFENGIETGALSLTLLDETSYVSHPNDAVAWNGLIDEVYVFNRALTQSEIIALKDNVPGSLLDRAYLVDILLKKLNVGKTYISDILTKKLNISKTYISDSFLKKLNIIKTYSIDSLLLKKPASKTYLIDLIFGQLQQKAKTYSIDLLIRKLAEGKDRKIKEKEDIITVQME